MLLVNWLNFFLENFYDLYNALYCNFVLFYCCFAEVLLSAWREYIDVIIYSGSEFSIQVELIFSKFAYHKRKMEMTDNTGNYPSRCLVEILEKSGVKDVVACPGSRNSPLDRKSVV